MVLVLMNYELFPVPKPPPPPGRGTEYCFSVGTALETVTGSELKAVPTGNVCTSFTC
jgi:hypothetical protein